MRATRQEQEHRMRGKPLFHAGFCSRGDSSPQACCEFRDAAARCASPMPERALNARRRLVGRFSVVAQIRGFRHCEVGVKL